MDQSRHEDVATRQLLDGNRLHARLLLIAETGPFRIHVDVEGVRLLPSYGDAVDPFRLGFRSGPAPRQEPGRDQDADDGAGMVPVSCSHADDRRTSEDAAHVRRLSRSD